jgi:hypothetical protein
MCAPDFVVEPLKRPFGIANRVAAFSPLHDAFETVPQRVPYAR